MFRGMICRDFWVRLGIKNLEKLKEAKYNIVVSDCRFPNELACNDDVIMFLNFQSSVELDVLTGETYLIKVASLGTDPLGGNLGFELTFSEASALIFADGFESGNTTVWSSSVP